MGIWALTFGGVIPIGSIYAGTLAQNLGIPATFIISASICLIFTVVLSIFTKPDKILLEQESIEA